MSVTAEVICDSLHPAGLSRLTTVRVRMHRYVLAEFNTHRDFSRNSASSRAIPFERQRERVMNDPAIPLSWGSNRPGMQAGDELEDDQQVLARRMWLEARDNAVRVASDMHVLGLHKQIVNRVLEPFMWHTVVVTSSKWDNFFAQRCSPLAQPEIRAAAEAMRDAIDASTPRQLTYESARIVRDLRFTEHLPFVTTVEGMWISISTLRAASTARCARTSYDHDDGREPNLEKDADLYRRLITARPMHASPLEHVATPARPDEWFTNGDGRNFGPMWKQHRAIVERGSSE